MAYRMKRAYGWIKQEEDERDFRAMIPRAAVPKAVDLRPLCPAVYDQGSLGSCSANAVCALYQFTAMEQNIVASRPSRLYQYYNTRVLEGTVDYDAGATIRGAMKALQGNGICLESTWPYRVTRFTEKPTKKCYAYGETSLKIQYVKVEQNEIALKSMLAANNPIAFGFVVPESFESEELARTGVFRMPSLNENMVGGHAVVLVGYDTPTRMYLVRNSWGSAWAQNGYYWMPENMVHSVDWCFDFTSVQMLT